MATGNRAFDSEVTYHEGQGHVPVWDRADAQGIRLVAYFNPRTRQLALIQLFPDVDGIGEVALDLDEFRGIERGLEDVVSMPVPQDGG